MSSIRLREVFLNDSEYDAFGDPKSAIRKSAVACDRASRKSSRRHSDGLKSSAHAYTIGEERGDARIGEKSRVENLVILHFRNTILRRCLSLCPFSRSRIVRDELHLKSSRDHRSGVHSNGRKNHIVPNRRHCEGRVHREEN